VYICKKKKVKKGMEKKRKEKMGKKRFGNLKIGTSGCCHLSDFSDLTARVTRPSVSFFVAFSATIQRKNISTLCIYPNLYIIYKMVSLDLNLK
jgi:hypothetical protein